MTNIQSLFPVYFAKQITEDHTPEDYNTQVTQNENALNQNLNILYNAVTALDSRLGALEMPTIPPILGDTTEEE